MITSIRRILGLKRRLRRDEKGAAALEFAFVAPAFLALLFAVMEFGRLFLFHVSLQYAVEQAGRYAVAHYTREKWSATEPDDQTAADAVELRVDTDPNTGIYLYGWTAPDIQADPVTVTVEGLPHDLRITGTVNFSFLVPFFPLPDITLRAETTVPLI